ncbi:MAG: hypothetical protein MI924_35360 [Chloroflexales bacterium]|nr:hypothetical protein [Chloroflexales bacterium]
MTIRFLVSEVHNFGGFFGGDTVTLSGEPWRDEQAEEQTLTIDEAALTNVPERHNIAAGMLLELQMADERVDKATLRAAQEHAVLRQALGPAMPSGPLAGPLILSYRCERCGLWVEGAPVSEGSAMRCGLCGEEIAAK